jgi:hypothetical protein
MYHILMYQNIGKTSFSLRLRFLGLYSRHVQMRCVYENSIVYVTHILYIFAYTSYLQTLRIQALWIPLLMCVLHKQRQEREITRQKLLRYCCLQNGLNNFFLLCQTHYRKINVTNIMGKNIYLNCILH